MSSHQRFKLLSVKSLMASWHILPPVSPGYCFTRIQRLASVPPRDSFTHTTTIHRDVLVCSYTGVERKSKILKEMENLTTQLNTVDV